MPGIGAISRKKSVRGIGGPNLDTAADVEVALLLKYQRTLFDLPRCIRIWSWRPSWGCRGRSSSDRRTRHHAEHDRNSCHAKYSMVFILNLPRNKSGLLGSILCVQSLAL